MCTVRSQLQANEKYPEDRSLCPSDDVGCVVGSLAQAAIFPIMTMTETKFNTQVGSVRPVPDPSNFVPPPGHVFDPTGGLVPRPADYVLPTEFDTTDSEEEGLGLAVERRYYTGMDVHIAINETGHFVPTHIGVQEGARITWELHGWEVASVDESRGVFSSGMLSRVLAPGARRSFSVRFGDPAAAPINASALAVDALVSRTGLYRVHNQCAPSHPRTPAVARTPRAL
jgi:hypothetical protein